jgi:CHAD domain-containing protein
MASVPVLARLIARPLDALTEHLPRAIEGHQHSIHQARVASRRLRELWPIVGRALDKGPRRRLGRRLRALTRTLGPVREIDVTLTSIADMTSGMATPPALAAALMRTLEQERTNALSKLAHRFDPGRVERLLGRLRRVESVLREGVEPENWRGRLARRVRRRASALAQAVADAGALFVSERLHAVRIAGKQLRYALEVAGDARLASTSVSLRTLKDSQDVLGKLHDADVLLAVVAGATRAGRTAKDTNQAAGPAVDVAADAEWFDREITTETRRLHARYLRRQARLVALADHALDTLAPRIEQPPVRQERRPAAKIREKSAEASATRADA